MRVWDVCEGVGCVCVRVYVCGCVCVCARVREEPTSLPIFESTLLCNSAGTKIKLLQR